MCGAAREQVEAEESVSRRGTHAATTTTLPPRDRLTRWIRPWAVLVALLSECSLCLALWSEPFPGDPLVDCNSLAGWTVERDDAGGGPPCTAVSSLAAGYDGQAVRLDYDFLVEGSVYRGWAQLRYDFEVPRDLSGWDTIRFRFRGEGAKNHLQFWLHDADDDRAGLQIDRVTDVGGWTYWSVTYAVPSRGIEASMIRRPYGWEGGDGTFDITRVKKLFFAVSRDTSREAAAVRSGALLVDDIRVVDSIGRNDPTAFSRTAGDGARAERAAQWIASQQKSSGLVQSWAEETVANGSIPKAHIYDQALALIVFLRTGRLTAAKKLAEALVAIQEPDGAWYKWYRPDEPSPAVHGELWEGDIAWAAYALMIFWHRTGWEPARASSRAACNWLKARIDARNAKGNPETNGSVHDSVEANVDAWFAFDLVGGFDDYADQVENFLLARGWDSWRRRFCRGPYAIDPANAIDVHTWGAEFLLRIGEQARARATLGYAAGTLSSTSLDGTVHGFGSQGPVGVWFEGVGQWVAARGCNADAYLAELNASQAANGSLPNSPDDFGCQDVWLSRWHGVAPTAWCFFANTCPVFSQGIIRGKVRRTKGTISSGTVTVYPKGSKTPVSSGVIHADGSYWVGGLEAGEYKLRANASRCRQISRKVQLSHGEVKSLDLLLPSKKP